MALSRREQNRSVSRIAIDTEEPPSADRFHLWAIRFDSQPTLADLENTQTHLQPTQSRIQPILADREKTRTHLWPIHSLI